MTAVIDVQELAIGIGMLVAVFVVLYGTFVTQTIGGVDATTVAAWVFAGTFVLVAISHASIGSYDLAFGHGGAAVGWVFVLLGSSGRQVIIGLIVLGLSGAYVVTVTLRRRKSRD